MPEQTENETRGQAKKFFLVGILGAAAGAVTAFLLTPWRGAEAPPKLKEGAQKAGAAAREAAAKAGKAASDAAAAAARRARGEHPEKKENEDN